MIAAAGPGAAEGPEPQLELEAWVVAEEPPRDEEALVVALDGFEGPLDLLLILARTQKVDLAKISVLALAASPMSVCATSPCGISSRTRAVCAMDTCFVNWLRRRTRVSIAWMRSFNCLLAKRD